jgi:hypothetical protein
MPWSDHHRESEQFASDAHLARAQGDVALATQLFRSAAAAEERALEALAHDKPRTRGITAVSAVSLLFKSNDFDRTEQLACRVLSEQNVPGFSRNELRLLVQAIWTERAKASAGLSFLPGQVTVSIQGGEVVAGGAPLDMIVEKTQTTQAIFYRTLEFEQNLPFRKSGGPPRIVADACQPWLFQSPPGSYQFSVVVRNDPQADMLKTSPNPTALATRFLDIIQAIAEEGRLEKFVGGENYRSTFRKLARNLAPTGKAYSRIEFRSDRELSDPVVLTPESRIAINRLIRSPVEPSANVGQAIEQHVSRRGILRALDFNNDWLELSEEDGNRVRYYHLQDTVDDVIGPMVNKRVVVRAVASKKSFNFRDIELDE